MITKFTYSLLLLLSVYFNSFAQNLISVPFNDGFLGHYSGSNSASPAYKFTQLGLTMAQFGQITTGTVFSAQGNDIPGIVFITDYNGVEHAIDGFIQWRCPSGGNPSTMVFTPAPNTNEVIATNGANGSSSFTVKGSSVAVSPAYPSCIGLTKNGQTLNLSLGGTASGNAATSGLLDDLNTYLGSLPKISINDNTVNETSGTATLTVSLSQSTTNTVSTRINIIDSTAVHISDFTVPSYPTYTGTITFPPGSTTATITFNIINDGIDEYTEKIKVTLEDPVNASILKNTGFITINDPSGLGIELKDFTASCEEQKYTITWSTYKEWNTSHFVVQQSLDAQTWVDVASTNAAGNSNAVLDYELIVNQKGLMDASYFRLMQVDLDGTSTTYAPIFTSCELKERFLVELFPQPVSDDVLSVYISNKKEEHIYLTIRNLEGLTFEAQEKNVGSGKSLIPFDVSTLPSGIYFLEIVRGEEKVIKRFIKF